MHYSAQMPTPGLANLLAMRYEARAYGTRQEIIAELENNLGSHRSERRQREARAALSQLEAGAASVQFGHTLYVVTDDQR